MELPDSLLSHVFSFAGGKNVANASYVCNKWARLVREDPSMWQKLCLNDFGLKTSWNESKKWRDTYIREWSLRTRPLEVSALDFNVGPSLPVWTKCLQLHSEKLVAGLENGMLKIWNLRGGTRLVATLRGHTESVVSVHFDGKTVVSGSEDNTVKVWDAASGRCSKTIEVDQVDCVQFGDSTVIAGSMIQPIKLWDASSGQLKGSLPDASAGSFCLDLFGSRLVSGSSLDMIHMWDVERRDRVGFFEGHSDWVLDVKSDENRVVSASRDHTIKVWDPRNGECCRTLHGRQCGAVWCVGFDDCKVISGSDDGYMRLWDLRNGKQIRAIGVHDFSCRTMFSGVNSLQFDANRIVTAGRDYLVKIWTVT
ncbi:hypothetical protein BSKO_00113 [Bryopsis sp. KO-2023]|nr:hypothetical protein BSKO_00113 [Bryopsis sp. KO-2023]